MRKAGAIRRSADHRRRRSTIVSPRCRGGRRRTTGRDLCRGLGDADQGARIPQSGEPDRSSSTRANRSGAGSTVRCWNRSPSRPPASSPRGSAGLRSGELHTDHLRGRRGETEESRTRISRAERFQIPLGLALLALLMDLFTGRFSRPSLSVRHWSSRGYLPGSANPPFADGHNSVAGALVVAVSPSPGRTPASRKGRSRRAGHTTALKSSKRLREVRRGPGRTGENAFRPRSDRRV